MADVAPLTEAAEAAEQMWGEIEGAEVKYGPFTSSHEGLGVLTEEMKELADAIHANRLEAIRHEAIQVAAVALRLAAACRGNDAFRVRSGG